MSMLTLLKIVCQSPIGSSVIATLISTILISLFIFISRKSIVSKIKSTIDENQITYDNLTDTLINGYGVHLCPDCKRSVSYPLFTLFNKYNPCKCGKKWFK